MSGIESATRRLGRLFAAASLALLQATAHAELTIEITGAGANRIPVAIADFGGDAASSRVVTSVIRGDLERSGLIRIVDTGSLVMTEASPVAYPEWRGRGADALVAGSIGASDDGRQEARFRLYDVNKQNVLAGSAFVTSKAMLRAAGHRIADVIYEKLTGEPGIFSTRVAYVVRSGPARYELHISDADGQNAQIALISKEPIISPSWSPDGSRLAYVSFENKKPVVYVHSLASGKRAVVANFKGSNSAPAWAPDGRKLAVVLSKEGGSQIFLVNADGSGAQRLTSDGAINTEPSFSPDGQYVYFTSDRGGSPQIYRIAVGGGEVQRVSFEGSYNVTPRISPDGNTMAFISRRDGSFRLAVMDLASRQVQILSDSHKDESPTFSPNGRMILIATEMGGRGVLSAVSTDGRIKQRLSITAGDVREPAWGPFGR
ncbi:Tol-Pal system beta propeller repeat protein TolB [Accumulibacter sp.]|uniref:Tol-Pal system beta propeller repeat protein TolB n=1 Tax=Accumulibacter sp. TaxID=2053492 RepID=UPI0025D7641E|nr:Tol-Pal system beta propeller repeat protein TolB [Accumulibacter sp.]MCM8596299.1 Tol-Pal system beta propeller repeat protein TolB [Accumulibacter sp.]MCM8624553.1 Tol-Pal system beta propeller repeat protein TolB [Accumulibacter sp.]MDS4050448.1 Tol-Pal system beta propeller repeat protein TolB [Accumulibacter sp.]